MRKGKMRFTRYVAFVEEMRNIYKILENLKGSSCWGDLSIVGRMTLKFIEGVDWILMTLGSVE
jgi:hypothetical protein